MLETSSYVLYLDASTVKELSGFAQRHYIANNMANAVVECLSSVCLITR